jgi:hypothetical protein
MPSFKNFQLIFACLLFIIVATAFHLVSFFFASAQIISSDAIAIRVIPNPSHYSALRWYNEQEFVGSPQSLTVDGYEAVRDGRTVYVNATNINASNLYTNIYLISYNQEAESATVDIFSQILSHWRFNINITSPGHCRQDNSIVCLKDDECPVGDFCDSPKARIIRDTKRLSDLTEINMILDNSYNSEGYYPKLDAGTYLPHKTLSVWPSWQETFSNELNISLPIDPINKLGDCPGYNEVTCWNEQTKQFVKDLPDLPNSSLAYIYYTDVNGAISHLCSVFESGLLITGVNITAGCPEICLDFDGDGYGFPGSSMCTFSETDCDDTNPLVGVGVPENPGSGNCDDGNDNDCDGLIDCEDPDCINDPNCVVTCTDFVCNGICTPPCTPTEDPDCTGAGCCGDGNCDTGENSSNCSADCACTDFVCNGICTPPCTPTEDPDCTGVGCCGDGNCDTGENSLSCLVDCFCTDNDSDGYGVCPDCGVIHGCTFNGDDCDDTVSGAAINPGATEICDGIDNDCNGLTTDGSGEVAPFNSKQDNICAGSLQSCYGILGWLDDYSGVFNYEDSEVSCTDSIDNDCDTLPDGLDPDCTGTCFGVYIDESLWYVASEDPDCDQCDYDDDNDGDQSPGSWSLYPGMADQCDDDCGIVSATVVFTDYEDGVEVTCDDLIDNDCDGHVDCADSPDCDMACCVDTCNSPSQPNCQAVAPSNSQAGVGACCSPAESCYECQTGFFWDGSNCVATCEDKDHDFYSTIGGGNCCGPANDQPCNPGIDCDDNIDWINPGATETCDNNDNNCVGGIDEGCDDDSDDYCDITMTFYNFPVAVCPNTNVPDGSPGDDCDDAPLACGASCFPGNSDICDGYDNDCNIATTDGSGEATPLNSKQADICAGTVQSCNGSSGWQDDYSGVTPPYEAVEVTCDDFLDNDCDGSTDCSDSPDCDSHPACSSTCVFTFAFPCFFP